MGGRMDKWVVGSINDWVGGFLKKQEMFVKH